MPLVCGGPAIMAPPLLQLVSVRPIEPPPAAEVANLTVEMVHVLLAGKNAGKHRRASADRVRARRGGYRVYDHHADVTAEGAAGSTRSSAAPSAEGQACAASSAAAAITDLSHVTPAALSPQSPHPPPLAWPSRRLALTACFFVPAAPGDQFDAHTCEEEEEACMLWFHTAFTDGTTIIRFAKAEIDKACKQKADKVRRLRDRADDARAPQIGAELERETREELLEQTGLLPDGDATDGGSDGDRWCPLAATEPARRRLRRRRPRGCGRVRRVRRVRRVCRVRRAGGERDAAAARTAAVQVGPRACACARATSSRARCSRWPTRRQTTTRPSSTTSSSAYRATPVDPPCKPSHQAPLHLLQRVSVKPKLKHVGTERTTPNIQSNV